MTGHSVGLEGFACIVTNWWKWSDRSNPVFWCSSAFPEQCWFWLLVKSKTMVVGWPDQRKWHPPSLLAVPWLLVAIILIYCIIYFFGYYLKSSISLFMLFVSSFQLHCPLQQLANHLKPQHAIPSHRIWPSAHQEICESSGGLSEQNPLCHGFFPLTLLPLNFAKPPLKFAHGRLHGHIVANLGGMKASNFYLPRWGGPVVWESPGDKRNQDNAHKARTPTSACAAGELSRVPPRT